MYIAYLLCKYNTYISFLLASQSVCECCSLSLSLSLPFSPCVSVSFSLSVCLSVSLSLSLSISLLLLIQTLFPDNLSSLYRTTCPYKRFGENKLKFPFGVCCNPDGTVFVSDWEAGLIYQVKAVVRVLIEYRAG